MWPSDIARDRITLWLQDAYYLSYDWVDDYFRVKTNQILNFQSSEEYFFSYEQAIFHALICINTKDWITKKTSDWYSLSEPAEWWSEEYDFEKNSWNVNCSQEMTYQKTLDLFIEFSQFTDYSYLVLETDEFQVVKKWTFVSF